MLKVISRNSKLAIKQVEEVFALFPQLEYEIVPVLSYGDKHKKISLIENKIPDFFTREPDNALIRGEADIAVHSAKDLPYPVPEGLEIIALLAETDKREALVSQFRSHSLQGHLAVVARSDRNDLKELFSKVDIRKHFGVVHLVGFGPGDPELLTLKGLRLLKLADVIIYDDLINADYLIEFAGEKIYVGKRKGDHSSEQDDINQLLYEKAIAGKSVVRLKGGDPLLFGRGGEEIKYLQERLIEVEVIPGITSALAAAAYTKIPLTQRTVSSSVAFCTGHSRTEIQVPKADTLVYYMSASNLQNVTKKIIESGKHESMPIAIIRNISLPDQELHISTLKEIRDCDKKFLSPIIAIVGDTVSLNHTVNRKLSTTKIVKFGFIILCIIMLLKPVNSFSQIKDTIFTTRNIELGEVEIIGQKTSAVYSHLARKVTIISREEIDSSPASTIQDLLEYVASVDIRQRNIHGVQADVQLRGGTFDQVLILLNGINIADPQTGHFNLDLPVELSSIERIEILHGSGARIYGANAYKGVINIITKKNFNLIGGGIDFGKYNLFNSHITLNLNKGKLYNGVSFSRNTSDGFTENTDYKINHLYYHGGINDQHINIYWQAGLNRKAFGANNFYSPSFPEQYEETAMGFGSFGFSTKGKIKLSGVGYWRRHYDHFLLKRNDPSFYENYHLTDIYGIRVNANFASILGKTSFGIEGRNEDILSTVLGEDLSSPVKVRATDSAYYTKDFARNTFDYFLEQNYIINNFSVTGGFLLNMNNDYHNKIEIFPGIDVSYRLFDEKAKLFASLNRSLRLPTFTDMFYKDPSNEGNPELNPEELLAFETGMEYKLKEISTSLTLFRDQGKHVIDWIWLTDRQIYKAMNITEVTTRGFEITGEYHSQNNSDRSFRLNKLGASYTFIDLEKATGNFESKYSLDYLKHKLRFYFTYDISGKFHSTWQVNYLSRNGSYIDYDSSTKTRFISSFKPYWLVDAKLYYNIRIIKLYAGVSNLLDTRYTDIGNLIQPGRWIIGGIQFNLSFGDQLNKN